MIEIGNTNILNVSRKVDFGYYLKDEEDNEILLPGKYVDHELTEGEQLSVFVYTDSSDRPVAVTTEPLAKVGDLVSLKVKDITKIGAFLDWGLEKDLLLPKREQRHELKNGDNVVVKVLLDETTNRVYATSKIEPFLTGDVRELMEGKKAEFLIYGKTDLGFLAVINLNHSGILYHSEVFETLHIGDTCQGYIKKIRKDEKIDLSLQKQGFRNVIDDNTSIVLSKLSECGGTLPYHDKSSPEEIYNTFKISKKAFKKAIGVLYKEGEITLTDKGITLRK